MRRALSISTFFLLLAAAFIVIAARPKTKDPITIDYVKSKMSVNKTTLDSVKKYFGKPIQKKFYQHVTFIFDKMENGLPGSLTVNFYDSIVKPSSLVKSWVFTQPTKQKISEGLDN